MLPLLRAPQPCQEAAQSRAHRNGCLIQAGQTFSCKHFNTSVLPPGKEVAKYLTKIKELKILDSEPTWLVKAQVVIFPLL